MPRLLLLVFTLSLGSCFFGERRMNAPIDANALASLQIGVSTASDVTAALGAPEQVVELGEKSAWLYRHNHEKNVGIFLLAIGLYGEDTQSDRVWTFFDKNGALTHIGATLQAKDAEFHLPGLD
ncbi:MAG: hypothetical protein MK209_09570 [Planctomycetes bacterium]|nr:hypothetical protein [Planctomycetota bacterium]